MSRPPLPIATTSSTSWCRSLGEARVRHAADLALGDRQHRIGRLHEEERRLAAGEAHLLRVLDVVAADAVDAVDREGLAAAPATGTMAPAAAAMTWLMDGALGGLRRSNDALRPARPRAVHDDATAPPYTRAMFAPRSIKHCRACGGEVRYQTPADDNRDRATCTVCATIHYENPLNVVGTLPVWEDKVLLCRRNIEPRHGLWTLPAGFMELGETTAQGAVRETNEEAGARVELEGLYTLINVVRVGQVHLFYRARMLDTDFAPGPGDDRGELFAEAEIPWDEIAFRTTKMTLELFFADRREGRFTFHGADIGLRRAGGACSRGRARGRSDPRRLQLDAAGLRWPPRLAPPSRGWPPGSPGSGAE